MNPNKLSSRENKVFAALALGGAVLAGTLVAANADNSECDPNGDQCVTPTAPEKGNGTTTTTTTSPVETTSTTTTTPETTTTVHEETTTTVPEVTTTTNLTVVTSAPPTLPRIEVTVAPKPDAAPTK